MLADTVEQRLESIYNELLSLHPSPASVEVGLIGAMAWLNEAAKKFMAQKHGRICGISSISGDRGRRAYPAYHATKAGLDTFLESLRNRLSTNDFAGVAEGVRALRQREPGKLGEGYITRLKSVEDRLDGRRGELFRQGGNLLETVSMII